MAGMTRDKQYGKRAEYNPKKFFDILNINKLKSVKKGLSIDFNRFMKLSDLETISTNNKD